MDLLYWVGGSAKDNVRTFATAAESMTGDIVQYPEPIVLAASVSGEHPVTGLVVSGTIEAPDGYYDVFTLRDDGVAPDDIAGDGVYAALLDYWMDGEYYITVMFDNSNYTGKYTLEGFALDEPILLPQFDPLEENFERFAELQVTVVGWQEDDHADWPDDSEWPATVVQTDNTAVHGRIDFADDVDVFEITVPSGYTDGMGLRIDNLGLGMDPYLYVYAADWSWEFDAYLETVPTSDDFMFVPLSVSADDTFYVEVWHFDMEATTGVYDISVGPYLASDPTAASATLKPAAFRLSPGYTQEAALDSVVAYTHVLTNTGSFTDTYHLRAANSHDWDVALVGDSWPTGTNLLPLIEVGSQTTRTFSVSVTVPGSISGGTVSNFTYITATSQLSPSLQGSIIDTTIVVSDDSYIYLPLVLRHP